MQRGQREAETNDLAIGSAVSASKRRMKETLDLASVRVDCDNVVDTDSLQQIGCHAP